MDLFVLSGFSLLFVFSHWSLFPGVSYIFFLFNANHWYLHWRDNLRLQLVFLSLQRIIFCSQHVVKIGADRRNVRRDLTDWRWCSLFPIFLLGGRPLCLPPKHLWYLPGHRCFLGSELCFFIFPDPWDFRKFCSASQLPDNSLHI